MNNSVFRFGERQKKATIFESSLKFLKKLEARQKFFPRMVCSLQEMSLTQKENAIISRMSRY